MPEVGNDKNATVERGGFSAVQNALIDVVDGVRSRRRGPIRVIVVNESHQGAAHASYNDRFGYR